MIKTKSSNAQIGLPPVLKRAVRNEMEGFCLGVSLDTRSRTFLAKTY